MQGVTKRTRLPITIYNLKALKHELHVSTSITVYNKASLVGRIYAGIIWLPEGK